MKLAPRATIYHVTAECDPIAKVGGLGEAVAGLRHSLDNVGRPTVLVMPDYGGAELLDETGETLDVPSWAGRCWARRGHTDRGGHVVLVGSSALRRPHPYVDPATGEAWHDNDQRFFSFAAGVASVINRDRPDLVHFHDWHGAAATCFLPSKMPVVLTIHNLAHQGVTTPAWLDRIGPLADPMRLPGGCDPLVGAIRCADVIVTVSPHYRDEILRTESSEGIAEILAVRSQHLIGVLNGLDQQLWDPATDVRLPFNYDAADLTGKQLCRSRLLATFDHSERTGPVVIVVSRMAHQKGIDLSLEAARLIAAHDGVLIVHGAGQRDVAHLVEVAAAADSEHVVVVPGYDETVAHRLIAGADLLLMPSRFEPCGLTQLQALRYGTIPVVTDVGGLHDTVIDDDEHRDTGTGFIARAISGEGVTDAVERAIAARHDSFRWEALQRRAMAFDSSWDAPAAAYAQLYDQLITDLSG